MRGKVYIAILLLLFCGISKGIAQNRNNLTISADHLVLRIDLQSVEKQVDSILKLAGVKSQNSKRVLKGDYSGLLDDAWVISATANNVVEFQRSLAGLNDNPQNTPFLITTRIPEFGGDAGYPTPVNYGINKLAKATIYNIAAGFTRFILPGYQQAKRVFLSGSFNQWSTLKGQMKKADGGWIIDVRLEPGAHEYKYIIDGRWRTDPNNLLEVNDGTGNINSVFYKYNYTFKLAGHAAAHKVILAGEFNNFNPEEIVMAKKGEVWQQEMYVGESRHTYNFIVDGHWITDPTNAAKEKDGDTLRSVLDLGTRFSFKLYGHTDLKQVFLAGNFNGWKPNDLKMQKTAYGWVYPVSLPQGNYNYKFIVNNDWITDPLNPFTAVEGGVLDSYIPVKPNYTFKLRGHANNKKVKLIGSFSNWEDGEYTMAHKGDEWTISLYLKPGKYRYKFVVDDRAIIDPSNRLYEPGDNNDSNSVLWIE